MSNVGNLARTELVLGGQRSGKSKRAELLACQWLQDSPQHRAVMVATAQPWDEEMRVRIVRHQLDRAVRVPGMHTVEESGALDEVILQHSAANTVVVIDCLTVWLTQLMMPADPATAVSEDAVLASSEALCRALAQAPGPVVLVSNEIGWGVIPMGREVRAFVDALGRLNQRVAASCERVTLMAAGLPLVLKGKP